MAVKRFYVQGGQDAQGWQTIDETGVAASTTGTGWVVSTGSTLRSQMQAGSERASGTFDSASYPPSALDTTLKDAFRTANPLSGSFASGNWIFNFVVRAVNNGGSQDGRIHFRLWKADADGSNATEITSGIQSASAVSNVSTSADFDSNLTFNPGAFSITNQYLFIQVAWERTGAGGMTNSDVDFRTGVSTTEGTRFLTSDFSATETGTATLLGAGSMVVSATIQSQETGQAALKGAGALSAIGKLSPLAPVDTFDHYRAADVYGALPGKGDPKSFDFFQSANPTATLTDKMVASGSGLSGQAAIKGAGTLAASASAEATGGAVVYGSAKATVAASAQATGTSALSGAGALVCAATVAVLGAATLAGAGSAQAQASAQATAQAALSGAGAVTAQASAQANASSALKGAGGLLPQATTTEYGTLLAKGAGSLAVNGTTSGGGGTAPPFRDISFAAGTDSTGEGTLPTNVQDTDLMIAFVCHSSSSATISQAPAGWTLQEPDPNPTDFTCWCYTRVKQSGDTNPTWTFNVAGNWTVDIVAYSNPDQTTPVNVDIGEQVAASFTITLGPITPTADNCTIVGYAATDSSTTGRTWTQSDSPNERLDRTDNSLSRSIADWYLTGGSGVAVSRDFTETVDAQDLAGFLLAIKPSATATNQAALKGAGSLSAAATSQAEGAVAAKGAGALTAFATTTEYGSVGAKGAGKLTPAASLTDHAQAAVSGAGSMVVAATTSSGDNQAPLDGAGKLTVAASSQATGAAQVKGAGAMVVSATTSSGNNQAPLSGAGKLTVAASANATGASVVYGSAKLTVGAASQANASSALSGAGALSATGQEGDSTGSASLRGSGSMSVSATCQTTGQALLRGAARIIALPYSDVFISAAAYRSYTVERRDYDYTLPVRDYDYTAERRDYNLVESVRDYDYKVEARTYEFVVPQGVSMSKTLSPPKQPAEVIDLDYIWTNVIEAGDTMSTATTTISPVEGGGLVKNGDPILQLANPPKVKQWVSGGNSGQTYTVSCRIVTTGGRTYEADFLVPVLD